MSIIERQDTNGVKPLLQVGELGYDNYPAGGDNGRVFVGTGTENIGLAKKTEVVAVDDKADAHIARVDNPHNVTKAQVGLSNADNTADVDKSVLSATKLTTPRNITISGEVAGSANFDGSADINISTTIQPNSVALGTDTTGNYVDSVIAGEGITVTGVVGEGGTPSIAIAPVGTSGTYTKVSTNDKGQVVSGELLTANDIPNLDASKITSGIIDAARLPASAGNIPEYATLSEFPIVGDSGKVYIALDTNKMYRWSGSTYVSIAGGVDSVAGKTGVVSLDKGDVGLTNVDNTSDANKPISTATQNALNTKVDTTTNQTIAGVKTFSSTIAGSISGNSATATKLATARTIGGVSFDGSANINLPGVNTQGTQDTTGDLVGSRYIGGGTEKPNNAIFGAGKLRYQMLSSSNLGTGVGAWNDVIWVSSYAGGDVKGSNALIMSKDSDYIGVSRSNFDATVWSTPKQLAYTDSNITGNAATATTATNVSGGKAKVQGTGNDYHLGGVELLGNGPANTVFPTIGFHQPQLYASSLQLRGSGDFRFYTQGGSSYANVTANTFIGNLSGNAATASYTPTLSALNNYVWSASTTPTGYPLGVQTSFVRAEDGFPDYGSIVNVNTYSGGGGSLQLYVPYGPANGGDSLKVRFGNYGVNQGNSWTSWKTLATTDGNVATATNAGYATTAGRAYPRTSGGGDLNFHWSGQGGQPTWLWGGIDGINMYVYNPSNFNVNYANSAGYAATVAAATPTSVGGIKARLDGTTLYITTNGANA